MQLLNDVVLAGWNLPQRHKRELPSSPPFAALQNYTQVSISISLIRNVLVATKQGIKLHNSGVQTSFTVNGQATFF